MPPIILGSSSKFRRRVLEENGYTEFEVMRPDIDEKAVVPADATTRSDSDPAKLVLAICEAKTRALLDTMKIEGPVERERLLICCDQVIDHHGRIREKPETTQECREYLKSYEIHPAVTVSGVMVTNTKTGQSAKGVDIARQYFKPIPEGVVDELIEKGDIMHCAGGFMVDDPIIHPYLDRREGDEDSIIGMPLKLLTTLIKQVATVEPAPPF